MVPADILRAASIGIRSHNRIITANSPTPTLKRHPAGLAGAVIAASLMAMAYTNVWPAPTARGSFNLALQSAPTYPVSGIASLAKMEIRTVRSS